MAKKNVTVAVDEEAYRRARLWAAENETSVSAVVNYCLEHLPGLEVTRRAVAEITAQRRRDRSGVTTLARVARKWLINTEKIPDCDRWSRELRPFQQLRRDRIKVSQELTSHFHPQNEPSSR